MALQAPEAVSAPMFTRIVRRRASHEFPGWLQLTLVLLFLWSWFAVEVVAPLARVPAQDRAAVAAAERAPVILVQAPAAR